MSSKPLLIAAAFFSFGITEAQLSQYFKDRDQYKYSLAENLYETRIFNASQYEYAQQYFYNETLSQTKKEAAHFFDNVIGVMLRKNHAEEGLAAFMKQHPNSALFAKANLPLADYYLAQKDFPKALETLQAVNQYQLSKQENTDYILKVGYAKFMSGDSKGAIQALEEAHRNGDEENKKDVAYMLGHLYYGNNENSKAFNLFDSIKDDAKYAAVVRPYYVQMFYNEKDYDQAIQEGNELLNTNISAAYKVEVHKIIGESYFMKNDYSSAYPHLKTYVDSKNTPSESDLYQMGFVAAQLQKFDEAVSYYNQLINSNSALAQNAYYQLGNAYLQTGRKQEALSAFRSAYQMTYDGSVTQLAHEQYAKLSYDIGNPFEAAPRVIQEYIRNFPSGSKTPEMRRLLVKSYLYSGDYKETLAALDQINSNTSETQKIDQEVSFLLGTEEFNKGNYNLAEQYFLRSIKTNQNREFYNRAVYWLGQTYFQKENFGDAITRYQQLLNAEQFPEKQQLTYDLGYAHFKAKNFDKAQQYFKEYLQNPKAEFRNDANLRLADTYYANNQLDEALKIYDQAGNANDYTLFQKGMAQGFQSNEQAKITTLKSLVSRYPNSDYADDALYEIASAYAAIDDFGNSNDYFGKVISSSKDLDLIANAEIYRAQNYIDQNDDQKAMNELNSLSSKYKNTSYAAKVVQAARPLFLKTGNTAGYQSFADNAGVSVNATEIGEINLSSAKQLYAAKNYKAAIPLYEKYLTQNPQGEGVYQAQYELGDSYYQSKDYSKALLVLQDVAAVQNDYQQDSRVRLAQIYILQNDLNEAKNQLNSLLNSSNSTIRNFANIEMMKISSQQDDLVQAEIFADAVLANTKNSAAVLESAKVIKARSLLKAGKDKDAQSAYTNLEKSSNTEVAAEALYAKAFYQNKAKAYKSSNETIFKLANNYNSEEYWGAKALVLMAKNYLALKDNYQASYTVDQVIANYQDFPDVVAEAREVKKQIKK